MADQSLKAGGLELHVDCVMVVEVVARVLDDIVVLSVGLVLPFDSGLEVILCRFPLPLLCALGGPPVFSLFLSFFLRPRLRRLLMLPLCLTFNDFGGSSSSAGIWGI